MESQSDDQQEKNYTISLQASCLSCIVHYLHDYRTEQLCLLPTGLRKRLLTSLPQLDVLKLEVTAVVSDLDLNEVWQESNELFSAEYKVCCLPPFFFGANTIQDDYRMLFLRKMTYQLFHRFNPSMLSDKLVKAFCDEKCNWIDCPMSFGGPWIPGNEMIDTDLMAARPIILPFRSEVARHQYHVQHQTSRFKIVPYYVWSRPYTMFLESPHQFRPNLIIPVRHAYQLDMDTFGFFKILCTGCQVKQKVLSINCMMMYYSELYQQFLGDGDTQNPARALLVELLSELECLELWWPKIKQPRRLSTKPSNFDIDSVVRCVPKTILMAIFDTPSPKLTSLCVRTSIFPFLGDCLSHIAPFFSAGHRREAIGSREFPACAPYAGLKTIVISTREISRRRCAKTLSAIILHQSCLEDLEISSTNECSPKYILDPIQSVLIQQQLRRFAFEGSWSANYHYERIFYKFLENNPNFEICVSINSHSVTIPAMNPQASSCQKKFLMNLIYAKKPFSCGIIFSWLQRAPVKAPLKLIHTDGRVDDNNLDSLGHCLSSCEALEWVESGIHPNVIETYFNQTSNPNLQSLTVTMSYSQPFAVAKLLRNVFASCLNLKKLSVSKFLHSDLDNEIYESLVSCPYSQQLSVDLRRDYLELADVERLLRVWRRMGEGKKLKSVLIGGEAQEMVGEMVLQNN